MYAFHGKFAEKSTFSFLYRTVWLMNYQNLHIYRVVSLKVKHIQATKSSLYVFHNLKISLKFLIWRLDFCGTETKKNGSDSVFH